VRDLCERELPLLDLVGRVSHRLQKDLGAHAFCSSQLDPITGLLVNSVLDVQDPVLLSGWSYCVGGVHGGGSDGRVEAGDEAEEECCGYGCGDDVGGDGDGPSLALGV